MGAEPKYQWLMKRTGDWEEKAMHIYHRFIRTKRAFIKNKFREREQWIWSQIAWPG